LVGWTVPANRASGARSAVGADVRLQTGPAVTGLERRSHRLRLFLAALGRHRPLLVLGLTAADEQLSLEEEDEVTHVVVVATPGLDWATVDRLSDGTVAAMLFSERELAEELAHSESLLADILASGPLLYGDPDLRIRILQKAGLAVPESLAESG
jgi:hypothetical protein